ncbi:hypothetical protein PhCBS80983_g04437 [Powellomyces hirtus]|uniref:Translation machinery-associated protein 16 n=1 Tax=Powellomyces hirtus TaxID=109895 RepID=A0A507E031_9FUNG|nr:hypothetical protein DFJ77DRAFT_430071 [Powellomyces hirtus]TPX56568.1 hypothetical protein PhCBS80983_g04437 [Powellomyces hirtus]
MPNNKKHKLSKIKDGDKAHPYSRKATQMRRAINRDEKMGKQKSASEIKRTRLVDRMLWFKFVIENDMQTATIEQVHDIIQMYIGRHDAEILTIEQSLRKGRPPPGRLELLRILRAKDMQEYNNGIEIPQLTDAKNVTRLKEWEGDYNAMASIKSVIIRKDLAEPAVGAKPDDTRSANETGMEVDASDVKKVPVFKFESVTTQEIAKPTAINIAKETGMDVDM